MTTIYNRIDPKAKTNIAQKLLDCFANQFPTVICLGSDRVLSDMVGVMTADILRTYCPREHIFGGKNRPILQRDIQSILDMTNEQVLFVDSGCLQCGEIALCTDKIKFFDKIIYHGVSLVANTIKVEKGKVMLANCTFQQIADYAQFLSQSILLFKKYSKVLSRNFDAGILSSRCELVN